MPIRVSVAVMLAAIAAAPIAAPAQRKLSASASPQALVRGPDAWVIYGTRVVLRRDPTVVGAGSVVAEPLSAPADPWSSGAVAPIPQALVAGQQVTVAFWAKAAKAETLALTFQ